MTLVEDQPVRSPVSKPPLTAIVGPASSVSTPSTSAEMITGASFVPWTLSVSVVAWLRPRLSVTVKLNCIGRGVADLKRIDGGIRHVEIGSVRKHQQIAVGPGDELSDVAGIAIHVGNGERDAAIASRVPGIGDHDCRRLSGRRRPD